METEEYTRGKCQPNEGQRKVDMFKKRRGGFVIGRKVHDNRKSHRGRVAVQGPFTCDVVWRMHGRRVG
jgi:hypothetical protein